MTCFASSLRTRAARGVLAVGVALQASIAGAVSAAAAPREPKGDQWVDYRQERVGLVFEYPANIFTVTGSDPTDVLKNRTDKRAGRTYYTSDKRASLQFATFPNFDKVAVSKLRDRALAASYKSAKIDYNRVADTWYVLSGTRGSKIFYERVHFSCSGKRLDIWSLVYPSAEAGRFNAMVDEMARRFRGHLGEIRCN